MRVALRHVASKRVASSQRCIIGHSQCCDRQCSAVQCLTTPAAGSSCAPNRPHALRAQRTTPSAAARRRIARSGRARPAHTVVRNARQGSARRRAVQLLARQDAAYYSHAHNGMPCYASYELRCIACRAVRRILRAVCCPIPCRAAQRHAVRPSAMLCGPAPCCMWPSAMPCGGTGQPCAAGSVVQCLMNR